MFKRFSRGAKQPPSLIDFNALIGGMVDRQRDALYDRVRLRHETPHLITCFQSPVAFPDPFNLNRIKTFADTNMTAIGVLNPPHDMIARRILFLFQPSCLPEDRAAFLGSYNWTLKLLERTKQREPVLVAAASGTPEAVIQNFGKGSWLDDKGDRVNDSTSLIEKLGDGIAWDLARDQELSIFIPPLLYFSVVLEGTPVPLAGELDFYVMIDGARDWAVQ